MLSRPELDINAQNLEGNTALLVAASFMFHMNPRSDRILKTLFFHPGVDREHKNKLGQSVLTRAIVQGSRMIQAIVKGTKLSYQFRDIDNHGKTLLSLAAAHDFSASGSCYGSGWSDSDWQFIVDMSPAEFLHHKDCNYLGETPEQIRQRWLNHLARRRHEKRLNLEIVEGVVDGLQPRVLVARQQ